MSANIERVFTPEEPLGPSTTPPQFQKERNKRLFTRIFDEHNVLSKELMVTHPGTILGRRGAGKTAYLYQLKYHGSFTFALELDAGQSFADVSDEIDRRFGGSSSSHTSIVENVARVWEKLIYTSVICHAYGEFSKDSRTHDDVRLEDVRLFLEKVGLLNVRIIHRVFRAMIGLFEKLAENKLEAGSEFAFLSDFIEGDYREAMGFDVAWENIVSIMEDHSANAVVLIDSLEQFPVLRSDMRASLSGLLHFVGETNRDLVPVSICVCLPAELHEEFTDISSNTAKDFDRVLTLHWNTLELYQMCARRYSLYIDANSPGLSAPIKLLGDRPTRHDVWDFWSQVFPEEISNRYGVVEATRSYISRHTQLLPRHFLGVMNKIAKLAASRAHSEFRFASEDILEGVRLAESEVCDGVISGFKQKYPNANDVLKLVLPNLPNLFNFELLTSVNREHGAGLENDPSDLLEKMVRMGVVGRFDTQSGVYATCRFDYTYNGQMPYSTTDVFGMHPAFSGQYRSADRWAPASPEDYKPIYPIEEFTGQRTRVSRKP